MGLRNYFRRILPGDHHFRNHERLRWLGPVLHDPDIFHLTRRSAAGGVATGLFVAFLPVPGQMLVAALAAILFRVNLPLSVVLVWITNPVTMPPVFYATYRLGAWILATPPSQIAFEFSPEWLGSTFLHIWEPLLLGSVIVGTVSALLGYLLVRGLWRLAVVIKLNERRLGRNRRDDEARE